MDRLQEIEKVIEKKTFQLEALSARAFLASTEAFQSFQRTSLAMGIQEVERQILKPRDEAPTDYQLGKLHGQLQALKGLTFTEAECNDSLKDIQGEIERLQGEKTQLQERKRIEPPKRRDVRAPNSGQESTPPKGDWR
jgi:predicted  nucleic acid-binding Zn-ribbon protein